jgi:hypothetical protein
MRKLLSALTVPMGLALLILPVQTQGEPPSPSITHSKTTMSPGQRVVVASEGAPPGAVVTITLDRSSSSGTTAHRPIASPSPAGAGLIVGRAVAEGDGSFTHSVTIPPDSEPGVYALISATDGRQLGTTALRIGTTSGKTVGTTLPLSSADVLPGVLAGAGLIVAGGLLLLGLPYRRSRIRW